MHKLTGNTDVVLSIAFSPDGMKLASGYWDNNIIVYNLEQFGFKNNEENQKSIKNFENQLPIHNKDNIGK